ncbi:HNH endonuclease [Curtobacterium sp. SGAir0471]|uniref:HNH endonuclease n=1 Tax=Curtobacterium sp. SGAir0471 TaxID=2070337 RepID=UPI001586C792|nr:HNH endonuclease [Curtobacterium sp. SGAir0471]
MNDDGSRSPIRSTIVSVSGRQAKDGRRGLPKVSEIEFSDEVGNTTRAAVVPNTAHRKAGEATLENVIQAEHFALCPICFEQPADSDEHVPPRGLGGSIMTTTCTRCNNAFGARVEAGLQDWFDRMVRIRYTADGDPRPFGATRALVLQTDDGKSLLLPEKGSDPGEEFSRRMRTAASLEHHVSQPGEAEVRNGVLKSAYLAACLHLRGVPHVDSAKQIRTELLGVVAARSRADLKVGPHARTLRFFRTGKPAGIPLALLRNKTMESGPSWLLSLAGTLIVEWPFPEIDPATRRLVASSPASRSSE